MGMISETLDQFLGPDNPRGTLSDGRLKWNERASTAELTKVELIQELLIAEGAAAILLGCSGLVYVYGVDTYVVKEKQGAVHVLDVHKVLESMGMDIASEHSASFTETQQGYECSLACSTAAGNTKGEAAVRAWLKCQGLKTDTAL